VATGKLRFYLPFSTIFGAENFNNFLSLKKMIFKQPKRFCRSSLFLSVIVIGNIWVFLYLNYPEYFYHKPIYKIDLTSKTNCGIIKEQPKTILLWTPFDGSYKNWIWTYPNSAINVTNSTCDLRCRVTDDQSLLETSDVVYISLTDINKVKNPQKISQLKI
jgi:hypothetical protein